MANVEAMEFLAGGDLIVATEMVITALTLGSRYY